MPVTKFPDPSEAPADGLLAIGGNLTPKTLLTAYSQGIFPWPITLSAEEAAASGKSELLAWFCPDPRAVLEFGDLHLPESLRRAQRKANYQFTIDQAFEDVIRACATAPRPGQSGSWINDEMIRAYLKFHSLGHAHSVEVWDGKELVGGIYGVEIQGAFAGESMFHHRPNASKLALLHLIAHLKSRGSTWMDIQQLTPHMKALGAKEISRDDFLTALSRTHALGLRLFDEP